MSCYGDGDAESLVLLGSVFVLLPWQGPVKRATAMATTGRAKNVATKPEASERVSYWQRVKLFKLCKMRYGNCFLPDNADGRALLMVLLRCWLSTYSAMEAARWLTETELRKIKRAAWAVDKDNLGALIKLTYNEREEAKLWFLSPCDVSLVEVKWRQRIKDKINTTRRKRRPRERELEGLWIMKTTDIRAEAIKHMLEQATLPKRTRPGIQPPPEVNYPAGWIPVPELMKQASALRTFYRPDGRPLRGLRQIVHRVLKRLASRRVIQMKMFGGMRGLVLCVKIPKLGDAWESAWQRYRNPPPPRPTQHESVTQIRTVTPSSPKKRHKMLMVQRLERQNGMSRSYKEDENVTHSGDATSSFLDASPMSPTLH
jgi:hypothetical protein